MLSGHLLSSPHLCRASLSSPQRLGHDGQYKMEFRLHFQWLFGVYDAFLVMRKGFRSSNVIFYSSKAFSQNRRHLLLRCCITRIDPSAVSTGIWSFFRAQSRSPCFPHWRSLTGGCNTISFSQDRYRPEVTGVEGPSQACMNSWSYLTNSSVYSMLMICRSDDWNRENTPEQWNLPTRIRYY